MNRKNLIALSILAVVGSNAAFASEGSDGYLREYGIDVRPAAASTTGARIAGAERTVASAEGQAGYLREYGIDARRVQSEVTREEVLAELQLWRDSGLAALERGEVGTDIHSAEYQRAAAKYAALRASPQFGELVEQIARQRGKPVVVVAR